MEISNIDNIDDILSGHKSHIHPETPESVDVSEESSEPEAVEPEAEYDYSEPEESAEPLKDNDTDEYGNEKEVENEAIRERLARQAKKHQAEIDLLRSQLQNQGASKEVQQAAKNFEYDPEESGDWKQQLESFVEQTVNSMSRKQEESRSRQQEQEAQQEFETKFRNGMNNFDDFVEVVSGLPFEISNPMTLATRAMDNPAAFLYAAAKRNPAELERISKMRDPYAQMAEMGKLEERMRKNKPSTQAPRPLGRHTEDTSKTVAKKTKEMSGDDLLAKADVKRLAQARNKTPSRR